ncbi:polysaccharide deacetylase family protein [Aestuariibacter salexigens]|uniref:polysaccharide deacetylase family protein n=1 Tax=Aestuariibacter salexigens TaxID=226010 RepID=UPI00041DCDCF|nr:polysaccharide deacetylase family protein [Aestuariibacter salexigens]
MDNATILLYHHVGSETPPSTTVSVETFKTHLEYLDKHTTVLPLQTIIEALQAGEALPDNAVAITFDDGYRNIYENAFPLLKRYDMPFTVFVNPPMIDTFSYQMTWEQMREMQKHGAQFANHTNEHLHLLDRQKDESHTAWLNRIRQDIVSAEQLLQDKLGYSLKYLAYPFGEYNRAIQQLVSELGFIGFAQQSGAVASYSDFTALPRFPAAGIYANLNTLKNKIHSLAMPVSQLPFDDPQRQSTESPGSFSYLLSQTEDVRIKQTGCYFSGDRLDVTVNDNKVTVQFDSPLPVGRSRVNCTAPSVSQAGRFYWFSQPFFVPRSDGSFPD